MKQLQGDESVQSFIFRVLMLNGESDFAGVLNRMGEWRAFPFVATMYSHLFRPYDPEYLLSVLQRSAIANPVAGMFSNPLSHFELVPTVFRNGVENYSQQTQNNYLKVNFCVDCIADDLKNCGFGFFRAEWLNQKYCHHHKKALFNLTGKSQSVAASNIQKALRGEIPTKCEQYDCYGEQTSLGTDVVENDVKFAPCLQKRLLHWLRKNCMQLEGETNDTERITSILMKKTGMYVQVDEVQLENVCNIVKDNHPNVFKAFVNEQSEEIYTSFKLDSHLFKNKLKVIKERNCSICKLHREGYQCSESKIISVAMKETNYKLLHENPCDYYLTNKRPYWNDYPLGGSNAIKDDVWSVFNKIKEVN
jgi:hypothetical protein